MSFIGSTERTRGTTSKLLSGGGEVVNHSSVLPFQGSGPATTPFFRLRTRLYAVAATPRARMNEPMVEIRLSAWRSAMSGYSYTRRGIPSRPIECWTRKVALKPTNVSQKESLPSDSDIIRPVIFGYQ